MAQPESSREISPADEDHALPQARAHSHPGIRLIRVVMVAARVTRGVLVLLLISLNTVLLCLLLYLCALAKLLAWTESARHRVRRFLARLPVLWIAVNNGVLDVMRVTRWDIDVPAGLDSRGCYLVISNHLAWSDVLVLQRSLNRRLPLLRFFVKSSLIWMPFLGQAWWVLDMPFVKRYSKARLQRHPELKGRDLESARAACEKFRGMPVAMMNFPEGTRFSTVKRDAGQAPYRNLLKPRIGGIGQVLYALGGELQELVDVTILYGEGKESGPRNPTLWQMVSGQISMVTVRVLRVPIPAHLLGRDFRVDLAFRSELEDWIGQLWERKDEQITRLLHGISAGRKKKGRARGHGAD